MKMALVWPNVYAGLIVGVFLLALAGNENAMKLCTESWEGMAVLLAGSGLRMAKDVAMKRAERSGRGTQDIGGNDL